MSLDHVSACLLPLRHDAFTESVLTGMRGAPVAPRLPGSKKDNPYLKCGAVLRAVDYPLTPSPFLRPSTLPPFSTPWSICPPILIHLALSESAVPPDSLSSLHFPSQRNRLPAANQCPSNRAGGPRSVSATQKTSNHPAESVAANHRRPSGQDHWFKPKQTTTVSTTAIATSHCRLPTPQPRIVGASSNRFLPTRAREKD